MWVWAKNTTNLKGLTDAEFNQGIPKDSELTSDYVNTALRDTCEALNVPSGPMPYDPNRVYNINDICTALCVKNNAGVVLYEVRAFKCWKNNTKGVAPFGNNATFTEKNGIKIYNETTMDLYIIRSNRSFPWDTIFNN